MFLFCLESVDEIFNMPANACLHVKSFRVSKHVKIQEKIGKTFYNRANLKPSSQNLIFNFFTSRYITRS